MTKIDEIVDPLLKLTLEVAAIAGWENIEEWNPNPKTEKPKRTFTGTNKNHPELEIVPDYTSDLNAIAKVFDFLDLDWACNRNANRYAYATHYKHGQMVTTTDSSLAIALCKLLLKLTADLKND